MRGLLRNSKAFTLIELMVVIAILAILAAAVVIVLDPAELLAQSRDSQRFSDLDTLSKSISLYQSQNNGSLPGSPDTLYISVPDTSATCNDLGLPSLPSGWSYACSAHPTESNGGGWIPINFSTNTSNGLAYLPIDPKNSTSTGLYYTYVVSGNQYELTALMESQKFNAQEEANPPTIYYPGVFAEGTSFNISPIYNTSSFIAYLPFGDTSASTTYDLSGNANNATLSGGYSITNGIVADAFDTGASGNGEISATQSASLNQATTLSIGFWVESLASASSYPVLFAKYNGSTGWQILQSGTTNELYMRVDTSGGTNQTFGYTTMLDGTWHYMVFDIDNGNYWVYKDGSLVSSGTYVQGTGFGNTSNFTVNSGNHFPNMLIDDIRIYSRDLSASEVKAIYNAAE